jgi:hypothetical protein
VQACSLVLSVYVACTGLVLRETGNGCCPVGSVLLLLCALLLTVVCLLCIGLLSCVYFVTCCVLCYCVCSAVLHGVVTGLLASSQYPKGPALTGHLDTGFSWCPCV